ncbi:Uncharacterised protein [Alcaligenes faecalis subsp. faecalis]|nr:Uncharacterised protein [Alcaligenes faecalis subsp. faecalis]
MWLRCREDYSPCIQRKFGLLLGFAAGAVSAWVVYGIYTSWSMFRNAPWWEVMTAIGTVGATLFAGYSVYQGRIISAENARRTRASVLEPKRASYYTLLMDCKASYNAMVGLMNSTKFDEPAQHQCIAYHWSKLCGADAFQVPIVEDGEWAILEEKLADLMAQVRASLDEAKAGISRLLALRISVSADAAIAEMHKIDDAVYRAGLAISGLYPESSYDGEMKQSRDEFMEVLGDFQKQ